MPIERRSGRRGFTLIEVTLVIAIGAILVASTLAAVRYYRDTSRIQAGKVNLSTIRLAADGYRYRTGNRLPLGIASTAQSVVPAGTVTIGAAFPNGFSVKRNDVLCIDSQKFTVTADPGSSQISVSPNPSGALVNKTVRAGLLGNMDDQCAELLRTGYSETAVIPGMGLSDPWLGYTSVRDSAGTKLPSYVTEGFDFDKNRTDNGTDVWGGLYYSASGEIEYVLPSTWSADVPYKTVGYFPGDPPHNWGK